MNTVTVLYLCLVLGLVIVFVLMNQFQKWMIYLSKGLFVLSVLGALVGVFTVRPFVYLAEVSLKNAGTLETIQKIDAALPISKVVAPVQNIIEQIKQLWNQKPVEEQDIVVIPTTVEKIGILEAEVYPGLVSVTAKTFKLTTMVLSILGLMVSVYANFGVSSVNELEKLKKKYELLEKKVASLA